MKIELLGFLITMAGLVFFTISLVIIILGKKVGDNTTQQQLIKVGKYVEINANSVIALLLITGSISLAPIAFTYWKPQLSNYVDKNEIDKEYFPLKDLSIIIYGAAVLENGKWADNVKIEVIRRLGEKVDTLVDKTGQQGEFFIDLKQTKPKEKYTIIWSKEGYVQQKLNFGFNEIPFPLRLSREGGN
jgi:hypothetical protein